MTSSVASRVVGSGAEGAVGAPQSLEARVVALTSGSGSAAGSLARPVAFTLTVTFGDATIRSACRGSSPKLRPSAAATGCLLRVAGAGAPILTLDGIVVHGAVCCAEGATLQLISCRFEGIVK